MCLALLRIGLRRNLLLLRFQKTIILLLRRERRSQLRLYHWWSRNDWKKWSSIECIRLRNVRMIVNDTNCSLGLPAIYCIVRGASIFGRWQHCGATGKAHPSRFSRCCSQQSRGLIWAGRPYRGQHRRVAASRWGPGRAIGVGLDPSCNHIW